MFALYDDPGEHDESGPVVPTTDHSRGHNVERGHNGGKEGKGGKHNKLHDWGVRGRWSAERKRSSRWHLHEGEAKFPSDNAQNDVFGSGMKMSLRP